MSKEHANYTNSLAGISKDDIICEFAYMLCTAPKGSHMAETRDVIYDSWRKNASVERGISEKQLKKNRLRALETGDKMSRIASVLKEITTDDGRMIALTLRVLMDFSDYLVKQSGVLDSDIDPSADWSSPEERLQRMLELRANLNWGKARDDWGPAIAYIRTFSDKKKCMAQLGKRGIPATGIFADLIDVVYGDKGILWFADQSGAKTDAQRISKYTNETDFYKVCMDRCYDRLMQIQSDFLFASASQTYGAYRGYALETLSDDSTGMRSARDDLKEENQHANILSVQKNESEIEITDDVYLDYWLAREILKIIFDYTRMGVDILSICRAADLKRRDAAETVKEAFLVREIWTDEQCSYRSRRDQEAVTGIIARIWVRKCIGLKMQELFSVRKDSDKEEDSKYKKLAEKLRKEKDNIEKQIAKAESDLEKETKRAKDSSKEVLAIKAEQKEALKEKDEQITRKDAEIEELKALLEMMGREDDEPEPDEDLPGRAEEEFRAYITEHKVLVWGLREETERKFRSRFPELSFASSDRRLTRQQITAYDVLIIATNYTGHGNFFAARDAADAAGIPRAFLDKTANTPEKLYKALDIAINGRK